MEFVLYLGANANGWKMMPARLFEYFQFDTFAVVNLIISKAVTKQYIVSI